MPVDEFLSSLGYKQREKVYRSIDLLERYGSELCFPEVDAIRGHKYKGLFELRTKFATDIFRVFYFVDNFDAILLHGIVKKQDKTPIKDLDIPLSRMIEYKWRQDNGME